MSRGNYTNPLVEEDDLIDPDDGRLRRRMYTAEVLS
jgi:hypothetical protein